MRRSETEPSQSSDASLHVITSDMMEGEDEVDDAGEGHLRHQTNRVFDMSSAQPSSIDLTQNTSNNKVLFMDGMGVKSHPISKHPSRRPSFSKQFNKTQNSR